jgi:3-hydroxy-9,10-secoandrosta-1,3,5(10)-triene-9,17-dione monooxygenase reductase component
MSSASPLDPARFRQVLGHFPTGVTVVTADPGGQPVGLTIGSFTSVSLDPPLVGFLPTKVSSSWPVIERAGRFCVNVLAADQVELCWRFAKERDDKFDGVDWAPSATTGSPLLAGVLAWIDCTVEGVVDAGDHWFVLGRVVDLDAVDRMDPMIFYRGKVGGFAG